MNERRNMKARMATMATGAAIVAALSLTSALPASAAVNDDTVESTTHTSQACVSLVTEAVKKGTTNLTLAVCTKTSTLTASAPRTVGVAEVQAVKASLNPEAYRTLLVAAVAGTVRSKAYSQSQNNITDQETQSGTFYYDGARVWVTTAYRGYTGTHRCVVNWAVGYGVSLEACNEGGTTTQRNLYQSWAFTPLNVGTWTETYTMHVNSSGSIWQ